MTQNTFPVVEIFGPTIQGEGPDVGAICSFVRFAFCDYRCVWCDSKYAWANEGDVLGDMSAQEIRAKLCQLNGDRSPMNVVLTGGNPCLQKGMNALINIMPHTRFSVETQGSIYRPWLQDCNLIVISPKLPSARVYGAHCPKHMEELRHFVRSLARGSNVSAHPRIAIKIVVFETWEVIDAIWLGLEAASHCSQHMDLFILVGTKPDDTTDDILNRQQHLISEVHKLSDNEHCIKAQRTFRNIRILPQMHVLLWGHSRGV